MTAADPLDLEAKLARDKVRTGLFGGSDAPPERIGTYEVTGRLGAGGMGVVLAARDVRLDRPVALKVLHPDATADERRRARLRREAEALAQLSHPNVVVVFEVGEHDGLLYLAMELVDGVPLSTWQRESGRTLDETLDVYEAIGEGLAAAHEAGLVHRDFKPDNVMVGADGRPRVLDFGLVRAEHELRSPEQTADDSPGGLRESLTTTGAVVGTAAYMAPEQHLGQVVGAASDQFSFCVSLYEAVYGERPFDGKTVLSLAQHVVAGKVRAPVAGHGVPSWLRAILLRGLQTDPSARYGSLAELLAELRQRRRRTGRAALWLGGGALVAAAVAVGAYVSPDACNDESEAMTGIWNEGRVVRVRDAFDRAAPAFGARTADRISPTLNAYVTTWSTDWVETCRARNGSADEAERRALDATSLCLDRARVRLESLVEQFADADAGVVEAADAAVGRLPELSACSGLEGQSDAPADDERRELEQTLERAKAMLDVGRTEEGSRLANDVVRRAEARGLVGAAAAGSILVGAGRMDAGALGDAEEHLQRAFFAATEHERDDVALDAATMLIAITGGENARYEDAEAWYGHARAVAARSATPMQSARLDYTWATILLGRGDFEPARELLERARESLERSTDPDDPLGYDILSAIGNGHLAAGDVEQAAQFHEQALQRAEARLGAEHPALASLLNNLARTRMAVQDYEAAAELMARSFEILRASRPPGQPQLESARLNHGLLLQRTGRLDEGIEHIQRATDAFAATFGADHPRTAFAEVKLGLALQELHRYDEAQSTLLRAVSSLESHPEQKPALVSALRAYGSVLHEQGQYEEVEQQQRRVLELQQQMHGEVHPDVAEALHWIGETLIERGEHERGQEYLQRALEMYAETLGPDHLMTANSAYILGVSEFRRGHHAEAEAWLVRAIEAVENSSGPSDLTIGHFCSVLGNVLSAQGRVADARAAFERALKIFEAQLGPEHPNVAYTLANLALSLRNAEGRLDEALELQLRALKILEASLPPDHIELSFTLHTTGVTLARMGRHREAIEYLERSLKIRENTTIAPALLADTRWALARSLAKTGQRARAEELARVAREAYAGAGEDYVGDVAEIDAWLK